MTSGIALRNAQKPRYDFTYQKKKEYGEQVVFRNKMDTTVDRYEKIVMNGFDPMVPFYT
jgi:hypothetical protein